MSISAFYSFHRSYLVLMPLIIKKIAMMNTKVALFKMHTTFCYCSLQFGELKEKILKFQPLQTHFAASNWMELEMNIYFQVEVGFACTCTIMILDSFLHFNMTFQFSYFSHLNTYVKWRDFSSNEASSKKSVTFKQFNLNDIAKVSKSVFL